MRHFLRRHGARSLHVVLLVEEVTPDVVQELRAEVGHLWSPKRIILRSGSALHVDHLQRVDFANAAAILVPGADVAYGGVEDSDTRVIKTVLSVSHHAGADGVVALPLLVTEMFDIRKLHLARRAYGGKIEILASSLFVSRLIAQTVRHAGMSHVFSELLGHSTGNEIYTRPCREFEGMPFQDLVEAFPNAVLMGFVSPSGESYEPVLNPPADTILQQQDRLVLLARSFADTAPQANYVPIRLARDRADDHAREEVALKRILILGWNLKVPALIGEFESYTSERFQIRCLSEVPAAERQEHLSRLGIEVAGVDVTMLEGDYTLPKDLLATEPATYDSIVFMGSDWLETDAESDARTLAGHLQIDSLLDRGARPDILLELLDPENSRLIGNSSEVLVSPNLISHMLAQTALRHEQRAVYDELFGPGGAEITFRSAALYGLCDRTVSVRQLQKIVVAQGDIALGVRIHGDSHTSNGMTLNPAGDSSWELGESDEIVVLTSY